MPKKINKQRLQRLKEKMNYGTLKGVERIKGAVNSVDMANMHFETIGLQGKYRLLLGDVAKNFWLMVYGKPGSGKSSFAIKFAKELASYHGKVAYLSLEEGIGYTIQEKFNRLQSNHPNIYILDNFKDLSKFDFVVIDSVSEAGLSVDFLRSLKKKYSKKGFVLVYHTTKTGAFRGKQSHAHLVDIVTKIENSIAMTEKTRFGQSWNEMQVF